VQLAKQQKKLVPNNCNRTCQLEDNIFFIRKRPGSRVLQQRLREIRENIETEKGEGGYYSVALSKHKNQEAVSSWWAAGTRLRITSFWQKRNDSLFVGAYPSPICKSKILVENIYRIVSQSRQNAAQISHKNEGLRESYMQHMYKK
jgi:deoxycytidylate deaminase